MTTEPTIHVAFLRHAESDLCRAFRGTTDIEAQDRAMAAMLETTADFRDFDEYPTDEAWIDVCYEEGWEIDIAILE